MTKKKILIWGFAEMLACFFLFNASVRTTAQSIQLDWAKSIGGIKGDQAARIAVDAKNNIYVTGSFGLTVDFDPGTGVKDITSTQTGSYGDAFLAKYDSSGQLIWAVGGILGGAAGVLPYPVSYSYHDLKADLYGNVYLVAQFSKTIDFDPGPGVTSLNSTNGNTVICKFDSSGNFVWARQYGKYTNSVYIELDDAGNLYLSGTFYEKSDFDPGTGIYEMTPGVGNQYGPYLIKVDSSGTLVWGKTWDAIMPYGSQSPVELAVTSYGDIYVGGIYTATADFDPGPGVFNMTPTGTTAYISKFDSSGTFLWAKHWVSCTQLSADTSGNLVGAGLFGGIVDFDPGAGITELTARGDGRYIPSIFIAKLDSSGNFKWAKQIEHGQRFNDDVQYPFSLDRKGNIFLTGNYRKKIEFDLYPGVKEFLGPTTSPHTNIFFAKITPAGTYDYIKTFRNPVTKVRIASQIAVSNTGGIYSAGSFDKTFDFDPGTGSYPLSSNGDFDVFFLKMNEIKCTNTYETINVDTCDQYMYNGIVYKASGTYQVLMPNKSGCDSNVTLNLTINQNASSNLTISECDSFTFGGQTYTASGNYTRRFSTVTGCDSTVYIYLTIKNSVEEHVSLKVCDSITIGGNTYTSSGLYDMHFTSSESCDSLVHLDLTIGLPDTTHIREISCGAYTWQGDTFSTSGIYAHTFSRVGGCDSVCVLDLNVVNLDPDVTVTGTSLTAAAAGVDYQWIDCDNGNAFVPGATSQTFTPVVSGNYAVIIGDRGCSDTSICTRVEVRSGIPGFEPDKKIFIYPNPATDHINVKADYKLYKAEIRLINAMGQEVFLQTIPEGDHFYFSLGGYAPGLYYVEISENGQQIIRMKLLKY